MKKKLLTVYRVDCDGHGSFDRDKGNALITIADLMDYQGHPITVTTITMSKKKWDSLESFDGDWEI